jgi:hypothetical protein
MWIQAACHCNHGRFLSHPKRLRGSASKKADRLESDYARQIEKPVRTETTPEFGARTCTLRSSLGFTHLRFAIDY